MERVEIKYSMIRETHDFSFTLLGNSDRSPGSSSGYKVTREAVEKVLRKYHYKLCERFLGPNASVLCGKLFSKGLLSVPVYQMVLESSTYKHVSQAFLECASAIYDDHSKFDVFLNVLKEDIVFVPIAESLRDEIQESMKQASLERISPLQPQPSLQRLFSNTPSNHKRPALMTHNVDSKIVPTTKRIKKDYAVCKQNSLEEMTKNIQSDIKKEDPCNHDIISSLAERYLSIKPDSFFDLFLVDTKRRIRFSLEKVLAACSEEVIAGLRSCILIEGESGRGKTVLLRHLASQWAKKEVLKEFSVVFLYEVFVVEQLQYIEKGTRKDHSRADLDRDNLIHQLEEDAKHLHGSTDRKDILILLDSFWHLPTQSIILTCRKYFPNAAIIFTAQPSFVKEIKSYERPSITHYFKVLGYEPNVINDVFQSLLPPHQVESFHSWLKSNPFAQALIHCPLYCKMLTELSLHDALPKYLENLTELFKLHVIFMINKSRKDSDRIEYVSDLTGDDDLLFRSIVEVSLIFPKFYEANSCGSRFNESFGLLKEINFNDHSIISFVNSSVMAYFMALSYTVSVSQPVYLPFDWSVFCSYLAGMKSVDKLNEMIQSAHSNSSETMNLFQMCLILFELQSSILEIPDGDFLHSKICECMNDWGNQTCSLEADPIAFYLIGWMCTALWTKSCLLSHLQDLVFDMPYVSQLSKYLFYFAKGTKHFDKLYNCSKASRWNLRIENVVDDIDECLQYLIDANLCKYVTKLQFSGTVNLANLAEIASTNQHLASLTNLDVTGKLTGEYNDSFSKIIPRLSQLNHLGLHNIAHEVDLKCLQDITSVCKSITIDGISPEFFIPILKGKNHGRLKFIKIMNCTLSPVIIESLIEWVTIMQSNHRGLRHSLTVQGRGILNVETSIQIARSLESFQNSFDDYDKSNFSIYLNDTTMSSAALAPIVDVVSSLRCHKVNLYIPIKYMYDFGERYSLNYSDMDWNNDLHYMNEI